MLKRTAVFAAAVILALGILGLSVSTKPDSTAGSWQVDTRHSDVKLISDATTDYGKTKLNITVGYARVGGRVKIDDVDATKSSVEFRFYPAMSMGPAINEDGKSLRRWLENVSNHTLVCFHSKQVVRTADGKVQATGDLTLTRVDRNVDLTPNEGYSGPVYGPPIIHRVSHVATFVFDPQDAGGNAQKESAMTGSTSMFREDFPQLVKTVVSTYWPPVVQDENCQVPDANEAYSGSKCTGTFMETPGLPEAPHAINAEDIGAQQNFDTVVGNHLTILLQLHLMARAGGEQAGGVE